MSVKEVISYTYHIRSSQRSAGTATDPVINLSTALSLISNSGIFQIIINGVQIPFSFYQMSSDINQIQVEFKDSSGNTKNSVITFQQGNYTALSILDELKTELINEAQVSSGLYTGFIPTLNFSYDLTTFKATLSMSSPANTSITIFFGLNQKAGIFFGFDSNITISPTQSATSSKIVLTNPVSYLLLRCSTLKQFKNTEFIVEKDVFSDILYKIPIYTGTNTWIQYNQPSEPIYVLNNNITSLNFYLTNNLTYTPVDLQGIDWSFSFTIREVERPSYQTKILAVNLLRPEQKEEPTEISPAQQSLIDELEKMKDENLQKLEKYKNKLGRNKDK